MTRKFQVSIYGQQEISLPEIASYDIKMIQAENISDGVRHALTHALKKPNYILKYNSPVNSVIQVGFYLLMEGDKEEKKEEVKKKTPPPAPKLELVPKKTDAPKKRFPDL